MTLRAKMPKHSNHHPKTANKPSIPFGRWIAPAVLAMLVLAVILTAGLQAPPTADAQSGDSEETCPGGGYNPTPTAVEIQAVPIVVESTTSDYFVLYVQHDVDEDTSIEIPVLIEKGAADTTTLAENVEALPKERYRVEKYQIANPADIDGDCIDDMTELQNLGEKNPLNPAAAIALSDGAVAIPDRDAFETLAVSGRYVKFAVFGADTDRPHIYFINTKTYTYHGGFQQALTALGIEESRAGDRFNGLLTFHPELQSADGSPGLYSIWTYRAEPFAVNNLIYTLFAANMPLLEDDFAFHLREQLQLAYRDTPLYEESRMHLLLDGDVAPEGDFVPINKAEGYGLLRSMDLEDSPNPRDVVIYEALPNELPRVAGIITTVAQTPLSHVSLRAVQDGVPNAFIRGALDKPDINALIGHYVQYTVTADGYTIRAATKAEIDNHYASSRPATAQTPQRDLSVTKITPLRWIGFDDWDAFGVKAANVAVLRALDFPEGTVPDGFAIPFYFYDEFMKHNGFYDDIREMLADPDFQSDFDTQESELKKLRKAIKKAETPQWIIDAIVEMNQGFPEGINRRYRSSTNNEDLPGFSGAGLYDSKSQKPSEDEEDLAKSLKEVYASLWNFRAFVERDFHRIDHLAAAMGILVHPSYQDEKVNGVAVSFDLIAGRFDYYYVNSQIGEDLVTNPEALSVPEEVLLDIYGGAILLGASNQVAPGQRLMSDDQLLLLRDHLFVIHHRFKRLYQPAADDPFAMEIEFKITSENKLAIKQARPWVFRSESQAGDTSEPSPTVTISGTAQVGQTLTADTSGITDEDGLTNVSYSYQWVRNDGNADTDIKGATASTHELSDSDEGKTVRVRVSFTDDADNEESRTSAATATVAPRPALTATFPSSPYQSARHKGADDRPQVIVAFSLPVKSFTKATPSVLLTSATVSSMRQHQEDGLENAWIFFLDPDGNEDIGFSLVAGQQCEGGGICTEDGDALSQGAAKTLPGPQEDEPQPDDQQQNNPATGAPTISGTAQVGETLTADTSAIADQDGLTNVSYRYQWVRSNNGADTDIAGETGSTYTLVFADQGSTIRVKVSFTDDDENEETLTGQATVAVAAAPNREATGSPAIGGTPQVDQTLTADTSAISDEDGLENVSYRYQWTAGGLDIDGATSSTYTLTASEQGQTIQVKVTFTDAADNEETLTSEATAAVTAAPAPLTGAFHDLPDSHDGATAFTFRVLFSEDVGISYVNMRDDAFSLSESDVTGARRVDGRNDLWEITVEPDDNSDVGITLPANRSCTTTGAICTREDSPRQLTNSPTATVTGPAEAPPTNTSAAGAPTISGTPQVEQTLTADTSSITDEDGLTNVSYAYQWTAGGTDIDGATSSSYKLTYSEQGQTIQVRVNFTDDADNEETLTSIATVAVAAAPNREATGAPTISGTPQVGEILTADTANIDDQDGLTNVSYGYQWTAGGSDIDGATSSTYTLTASEQGQTIQVKVTFTDDRNNAETRTSVATVAVAAAPVPLTAEFQDLPDSHDGSATFIFQVLFSEDVGISYVNMRDDAFSVSDGDVTGARRVNGRSDLWEITVEPDDNSDVGITLPANRSCSTAGAICTKEDTPRRLTNSPSATVPGPDDDSSSDTTEDTTEEPTATSQLSVADATASEEDDSTIDFVVTLNPTSEESVTVDYATANGTASSGSDYTAASGSITFAAGETSRTITVAIIDDSTEEDDETLTLTISNPSGAEISDGAATGTITDSEPVPLTARFSNVPSSHDGSSEFTFDLTFSENFPLSYVTLLDHAFSVTGGSVEAAQRTDKPSNISWRITVKPLGNGTITITLPETTDCNADGAICTDDGRKLSNPLSFTVPGPE